VSTPYEISFCEQEQIVTVRLSGKVAHKDHCAARDAALQMCREKHASRLLVDLHDLDTSASTTSGCFDFGELLAQKAQHIRIAHVLPADAKSRTDVQFTSTVVANRGVWTKDFQGLEEAKKWLLE
jgi:hypothetical protein